jgi:hypothetical protein
MPTPRRASRRYSVYVVQLKGRCSRCKRRRKPGGRCCLYVGYTGLSVEQRLQAHLDPPPHLKRTVVTECGGQLRPDLYRGMVFKTSEAAESAELSLAEHLRAKGYVVWGPGLKRSATRDNHGRAARRVVLASASAREQLS